LVIVVEEIGGQKRERREEGEGRGTRGNRKDRKERKKRKKHTSIRTSSLMTHNPNQLIKPTNIRSFILLQVRIDKRSKDRKFFFPLRSFVRQLTGDGSGIDGGVDKHRLGRVVCVRRGRCRRGRGGRSGRGLDLLPDLPPSLRPLPPVLIKVLQLLPDRQDLPLQLGSDQVGNVEVEGEFDFAHDFGLLVDVAAPVETDEVDG
jgi:hypothetical protein